MQRVLGDGLIPRFSVDNMGPAGTDPTSLKSQHTQGGKQQVTLSSLCDQDTLKVHTTLEIIVTCTRNSAFKHGIYRRGPFNLKHSVRLLLRPSSRPLQQLR